MTQSDKDQLLKLLEAEKVACISRMQSRPLASERIAGADEIDIATSGSQRDLGFHLTNRENSYLKKLETAILKFHNNAYGLCESCEEEIELRRLKARLTAELCIKCKEDQEREEKSVRE